MNFHTFYGRARRPVETCVVGTGGFGRSFLAQVGFCRLVNCRVAVDVDIELAAQGLLAARVAPEMIARCDTAEGASAAWRAGKFIAADALATVLHLPLDQVVEATGRPEEGAGTP